MQIDQNVTVTNLGLVSLEAGTHVKMALYTDAGNNPGTLVVSSQPATVIVGRQAIAVPATPVSAGDYWVMAVFDDETTLPAEDVQATPIRYRLQNFGDDMPLLFGAAEGYQGSDINYYVKAVP